MSLIGLLIAVLVVCVVLWAVQRLLTAFGIGDPIRTVIFVVVVLIALLWALGVLGGGPMIRL